METDLDKLNSLAIHVAWMVNIIENAESPDDWRQAFNRIFDQSEVTALLFKNLGHEFTWNDPDRDYDEDVRAYVRAASEQYAEIKAQLERENSA